MNLKQRVVISILLTVLVLSFIFFSYAIIGKIKIINEKIDDMGFTKEPLINNDKVLNGVVFKNVKVYHENLNIVFTMDVKNDSGKFIKGREYRICFLDKNNKELCNKKIYINNLKINGKLNLKEKLMVDIVDRYYDFKIADIK